MIVTCENCGSSFNLDDSLVKPTGTKVRCSNCKNVFVVSPPGKSSSAEESGPLSDSLADQSSGMADPEHGAQHEERSAPENFSTTAGEKSLAGETPSETGQQVETFDSSDLEMSLETDPVDKPAAVSSSESLEDLELDLSETFSTAPSDSAEVSSDELDFTELEALLETDPVDKPAAVSSSESLEDLDLELDLSEPSSTAPADSAEVSSDELDFSELEALLETDPVDKPAAVSSSESLEDLELDLSETFSTAPSDSAEVSSDELDFTELEALLETDPVDKSAAVSSSESLEDLDLELDLSETSSTAPSDSAEVSSDELDFSELEALLETDPVDKSAAVSSSESLEDLDLELDLSETSSAVSPGAADESDDFDFSKIEEMLELQPEQSTSESNLETEPTQEIELDLDLDTETISTSVSNKDNDMILEFDVEEEKPDMDQAAQDMNTSGGDEIQKKEDSGQITDADKLDAADEVGSEFSESESPFSGLADSQTENADDETFEFDAPGLGGGPAATLKKRKRLVPVLAALLIALLGIGGFAWYKGLVDIPSSHALSSAGDQDDGKYHINPLQTTINGRFVDNEKIGKLFVITGYVKNESKRSRGFVKVTGSLVTKDKADIIPKTVYCGNTLSDIELSHMDIAAINQRLLNREGDKQLNVKVDAGSKIPFMVVFSNLPANLENFTVKVSDSLPL